MSTFFRLRANTINCKINTNKCTMTQQNIRGLESSLDLLKATLKKLTPFVVVLTEHKMIESSIVLVS